MLCLLARQRQCIALLSGCYADEFLLDMNLSPRWLSTLGDARIEAIHWSQVGDPCAPDSLFASEASLNQGIFKYQGGIQRANMLLKQPIGELLDQFNRALFG